MIRYKNNDGNMQEHPEGGWVKFSEAEGTEQEIKNWLSKYAVHPWQCKIRETGKCTCGLNNFITKPTLG